MTLAFTHDVVREVVERTTSPARASALHAAAVVELSRRQQVEPLVLARHARLAGDVVLAAAALVQAADELVRVTRPNGRLGVICWTSDCFLGELFRTRGAHVPPPAGAVPPVRWGTLQGLADLFGDRVQWTSLRHDDWRLRFASPRAYVEYFAEHYGPTVKALERLDFGGQAALLDAIEQVVAGYNVATDGTAAWDSRYLLATGTVR